MASRVLGILVIAIAAGAAAGQIKFRSDTSSTREEAAQIAQRAEADLARLAEAGSLSLAESRALTERGRADEEATRRIVAQQRLVARSAVRFAVLVAGAVFATGVILLMFLRRRAVSQQPGV